MTLDDAIEHCEAKACESPCGLDLIQLAKWLKELKQAREALLPGPRCQRCKSPVLPGVELCHTCRTNSHPPEDDKWLAPLERWLPAAR